MRKRVAGSFLQLTVALTLMGLSSSALTNGEKLAKIKSMVDDYKKEYPEVVHAAIQEVVKVSGKEGVYIVDVRPIKERKVSIIPGSISREAFEKLVRKGKVTSKSTVFAYCTIGYRSGKFAQSLLKQKIPALNIWGGILAWTHAKQPLQDLQGKPVKKIHVYGKKWDLAHSKYETTW